MSDGVMSAAVLGELVQAGAAERLLAETEVGPTLYDGQWWYVPAHSPEGADYVLADGELAEQFDRLRLRAQAIADVEAME
jgi:hypothetical protein